MYTPPPFKSDMAAALAFAQARGNALAGLAGGKSRWLLAVNGADAYVSADWYVEGELGAHLDALNAKLESWVAPKPSSTVANASCGRRCLPTKPNRFERNVP
jgi:transcriptional regulator